MSRLFCIWDHAMQSCRGCFAFEPTSCKDIPFVWHLGRSHAILPRLFCVWGDLAQRCPHCFAFRAIACNFAPLSCNLPRPHAAIPCRAEKEELQILDSSCASSASDDGDPRQSAADVSPAGATTTKGSFYPRRARTARLPTPTTSMATCFRSPTRRVPPSFTSTMARATSPNRPAQAGR